MKAHYIKHDLLFKSAAKTSRNVLLDKPTWFIVLENSGKRGIGEIGIIKGLSPDDIPTIEEKINEVCTDIEYYIQNTEALSTYPSILFGLETALLHLNAKEDFILFENDFSKNEKSITINGLIWMGDAEYMKNQIKVKLEMGFRCLKLKIGSLNFEDELAILKEIRKAYSAKDIEIRVDANGAFLFEDALGKLNELAKLDLHSIEQPIAANQWDQLAELCKESPIPIALDEELISRNLADIEEILDRINPPYIILKPGLHGGFNMANEWVKQAEKRDIQWWATSALESNIGLNAIAQWVASKSISMPQGLGTGSLFTNNISSPLELIGENMRYSHSKEWDLRLFDA